MALLLATNRSPHSKWRNKMKNRMIAVCVATSALVCHLCWSGAIRQVSKTKSSSVSSDGTAKSTEKTVTQAPDGTVTNTRVQDHLSQQLELIRHPLQAYGYGRKHSLPIEEEKFVWNTQHLHHQTANRQSGLAETSVKNEAYSSGVSWAAVTAGALCPPRLSLILLSLGAGLVCPQFRHGRTLAPRPRR